MADNETQETNTTENRVPDGLSEHAPQNMSKLLPQDEREDSDSDSDSEEEHTQGDRSEENEPKNDGEKKKTRSAGDSHKNHSCKKESHKRDPSKKHSHKTHSHKDKSVSKIDTRSSSKGFCDIYTLRTLKILWNKGFADLKEVQEKLEKPGKKKKKLEEEEKELKKWLNDLHEGIKSKRS
ncbi:hypothetical protein LB505_013521 [Fusarium chuoi]|nr:hypothetical protein LB505_013521 [Fusarium chuoi]